MIGSVEYRNDCAADSHGRGKAAHIGENGAERFLARQALPFAGLRKCDQVGPFEIHEHGVPPMTSLGAKCDHNNLNISQPQRTSFAFAANFREARHA